jgi:hypothetical protein
MTCESELLGKQPRGVDLLRLILNAMLSYIISEMANASSSDLPSTAIPAVAAQRGLFVALPRAQPARPRYRQLVSDDELNRVLLSALGSTIADIGWTPWRVIFHSNYDVDVQPTAHISQANRVFMKHAWRDPAFPSAFPRFANIAAKEGPHQGIYEIGICTPRCKTIVPVNLGVTNETTDKVKANLYDRVALIAKYTPYEWILQDALLRRCDIVIRWWVVTKDVIPKTLLAKSEVGKSARDFALLSAPGRLESFLLDRFRWCCNKIEQPPATPTQPGNKQAATVIVRLRQSGDPFNAAVPRPANDLYLRLGDFSHVADEAKAKAATEHADQVKAAVAEKEALEARMQEEKKQADKERAARERLASVAAASAKAASDAQIAEHARKAIAAMDMKARMQAELHEKEEQLSAKEREIAQLRHMLLPDERMEDQEEDIGTELGVTLVQCRPFDPPPRRGDQIITCVGRDGKEELWRVPCSTPESEED